MYLLKFTIILLFGVGLFYFGTLVLEPGSEYDEVVKGWFW